MYNVYYYCLLYYYIIITLTIKKYSAISNTSMNLSFSQVNKQHYCNNVINHYKNTISVKLYCDFFCIGYQVPL